MTTFTKNRERLTAKDIANLTGYGRTQSFKHYRAIKLAKQARRETALKMNQAAKLRNEHVFVDDAATYFGIDPNVVRKVITS